MEYRVVGTAVPRKEARAKVTGTAEYVDDLIASRACCTASRSEARFRAAAFEHIHFDDGIPWDEFVIVSRAGHSR